MRKAQCGLVDVFFAYAHVRMHVFAFSHSVVHVFMVSMESCRYSLNIRHWVRFVPALFLAGFLLAVAVMCFTYVRTVTVTAYYRSYKQL